MNYADVKYTDIANGSGVRVSLFVQGCDFHCKGCFNPETWDWKKGKLFTNEVMEKILRRLSKPFIKGLTILGGEPLHKNNVLTVMKICMQVKEELPEKDIWIYTGFKYEDLNYNQLTVLNHADVLVDGQFEEDKKVIDLRFRGSINQRIIDLKKTRNSGEIILWNEC